MLINRTGWIVLLLAAAVSVTAAQDYSAMARRAKQLRLDGRNAAAESLYTLIQKAHPEDVDVMVGRGYCLLNMPGRTADAEKAFGRAVAASPGYVDAYLGLARLYRRQGKPEQARQALIRCRDAVKDNRQRLQYLATGAWQLGFIDLGRKLDTMVPPAAGRVLVEAPNRLTPYILYSPLEAGGYWQTTGVSFLRFFKPDIGGALLVASHTRDGDPDMEGGVSMFYRIRTDLTASYRLLVSGSDGYLALFRHQPGISWQALRRTSLTAGADLGKYTDGWLLAGAAGLKQTLGPVQLRYRVKGGVDPYDQTVLSHLAGLAAGNEERFSVLLGGAYGNETVEMSGAAYNGQNVATVFATIRKALSGRLLVSLTGAAEWRDGEYYRSIITLAPQLSF